MDFYAVIAMCHSPVKRTASGPYIIIARQMLSIIEASLSEMCKCSSNNEPDQATLQENAMILKLQMA